MLAPQINTRKERKEKEREEKKSLHTLQDSTELVCPSFTPGNEQASREASPMFRAGLLVLLVRGFCLFRFVFKP